VGADVQGGDLLFCLVGWENATATQVKKEMTGWLKKGLVKAGSLSGFALVG
jgi:hypothetical protein